MEFASSRLSRALAIAAMAAAPLRALPFPSYYDTNCAACHGTTTAGGVQTCAGCHSHGTHPDSTKSSINLTGVTAKTSYAPGEAVSVTINGGYRAGWVRALLYDQSLRELARSTGTVLPGFIAPSRGPGFPITLTAPAPTTPGTYTWWVAWYGNQYDATGAAFGPSWTPSSNPGHGEERVQTNAFTVVAPTSPTIALSPPSLSFGPVTVGTTASLATSVQNTGTAPLVVSTIAPCTGTGTAFTWSPAAPFTVQPGQRTTLTVTYAPLAARTESGCLTLSSNDPTNPAASLGLSGAGTNPATPVIALSPASLSFGTVTVGSSATLNAQVRDTGTAPLTVSAVTPCAGTSAAFRWSPAAPFTVASGGSTTLSVTYTPTATAGDTGCLTLASNDPLQPTVNLAVAGNGAVAPAPAIAFSPPTLDFGTVTIGTTQQRTAQLQNAGTATLTVTAVAPCSGAGTEFTWSVALPASVAPGQATPIVVTYTPTSSDFHSVCLAVSSNDPAKPVANLGLTAQGAAAPSPAVALSPAALDFMAVAVGASSSLVAQVQDAGGAALTVSTITRCVGTSAEFTWSPPAPFTVPLGGSRALTVTYAPVDAGPDNGCLALATDDPLHPTVNLGLSGSGTVTQAFPVIALVPASLQFGNVTVGGSAARTSQVGNTGNAPLRVFSVAACQGTGPEFGWDPTGPFTVAPGASVPLTVTFGPTRAGADTGCLTVVSDDPTNPSVQLALAGAGVSPSTSGVDVDIVRLRVPEDFDGEEASTIVPALLARNEGTAAGSAPARLVGVLDGVQVYDRTITLTLASGQSGRFEFPPFVPARGARGTLVWTATVQDDDADLDQATARTLLEGEGGDGEDPAGAPSGASGADLASVGSPGSGSGGLRMTAAGCSSGGAGAGLALLGLAAVLALRRSRRAA